MKPDKLLFEEETYVIRGAVFEVYREMGNDFSEPVYQECLELELAARGIPYEAQKDIPLHYKGTRLSHSCRPDLLCFGKICVELKAVSTLVDEHRAQLLNYLRLTGCRLGLLVNFGSYPKATVERLVL